MPAAKDNDIFHAIAHPARRAMLVALTRGDCSASDLAAPFRVSFPAISQHLHILEDADLVSARREGRRRVYRLQPGPLQGVVSWIGEFAQFFEERLDALGEYLDQKHGQKTKEWGARPGRKP